MAAAIIGRRVLIRFQTHRRGVITDIEQGCNGGVRVRFDGSDYSTSMVSADLAFENEYPAGDNLREYLTKNPFQFEGE